MSLRNHPQGHLPSCESAGRLHGLHRASDRPSLISTSSCRPRSYLWSKTRGEFLRPERSEQLLSYAPPLIENNACWSIGIFGSAALAWTEVR